MELLIPRLWQAPGKATVGDLYIDGVRECFTLEPAAVDPANEGHPCIPEGRYRVGIRNSPGFGPDTLEILKVPGRSDILFHAGNFAKDTKGCVILGLTYTVGAWEVHRSRDALNQAKGKVLRAMRENEDIWVEIHNSFKNKQVVA